MGEGQRGRKRSTISTSPQRHPKPLPPPMIQDGRFKMEPFELCLETLRYVIFNHPSSAYQIVDLLFRCKKKIVIFDILCFSIFASLAYLLKITRLKVIFSKRVWIKGGGQKHKQNRDSYFVYINSRTIELFGNISGQRVHTIP